MTEIRELSLGEKRVVTHFNPSNVSAVDMIKSDSADLINQIDAIPNGNSQCGRWKSLAMTAIEEGAMYAVKALTVGQDETMDMFHDDEGQVIG